MGQEDKINANAGNASTSSNDFKNLAEWKSLRSKTKSNLTRCKNNIVQKGNSYTLAELECKLGILEAHFKQYLNVQAAIDKVSLTDDDTDLKEEIEELYCFTKSKIITLKEPYVTSSSGNEDLNKTIVSLGSAFSNNFSKVEIPVFNGKYSEYPNFIGLFTNLIHKNSVLSPLEKFNELRNHLSDQALGAIYSSVDLRNLIDDVNAHLSAMQSIGDFENIANAMLVHLVMQKLDDRTQQNYEESVDHQKLSSWEDCARILSRRCLNMEAREAIRQESSNINRTHNKSNPKPNKNSSLAVTQKNCYYCKNTNHIIQKCYRFRKMRTHDRYTEVKKLGLCLLCLEKGHNVKDCRAEKCYVCHGNHHQLLHHETNTQSNQASSYGQTTDKSTMNGGFISSASQSCAASFSSMVGKEFSNPNQLVMLGTALINIKDANGNYQLVRALLDSASQLNFITEKMAQRLRLKRSMHHIEINGIGETSSVIRHKVEVNLKSRLNEFKLNLDTLVIPTITSNHPDTKIATEDWKIPKNLKLADPWFNIPSTIDLLIGAECFYELLSVGQIKLNPNLPSLQKTLFGWVVSGTVKKFKQDKMSCHMVSTPQNGKLLNELVQKFWTMEEKTISIAKFTEEEQKCEQAFLDNVRRTSCGRIMVKYPLKKDPKLLGDSREIATKRFLNLERRLNKNQDMKQQYIEFLKEYNQLGHMQLVEEERLSDIKYYAPHQAVLRPESTSTKVRVVFDCSCKTNSGVALNDILGKGPTIQNDLFSIIFRFRLFKFALTSDIMKMYRQILIAPEDTNYQCILWREDDSENIKTYRLNTVTYGTTSAPFLATRCIKYLADLFSSKYPEAAEVITSDFYMDDLITGADSIEDLQRLKNQITEILSSAHFTLRKWYSNEKAILNNIPVEEQEKLLRINDVDVIKTLGIVWNPQADEFCYLVPQILEVKRLTKRIVLSQTAQLFDPLGLVNPIIVRAKIFLQELWKLKLRWDDSLPISHHSLWLSYLSQLNKLNNIKVPRYVLSFRCKQSIQLHGFADASSKAYGCCIYVRCQDSEGEVTIHLIAAKSKVAPVITRTLPQLELGACELLVELWSKIKLNFKKKIEKSILWTDSEIVLYWLASLPSTWNTYVANRVARIQETCQNLAEWKHVCTSENPADIISRGCTIEELQQSIWFDGPKFLKQSCEFWPKQQFRNPQECKIERKQIKITLITKTSTTFAENYTNSNNFLKVRRRFGYICRFINCLKHRLNKSNIQQHKLNYVDSSSLVLPTLSANELTEAMYRIIWHIQQQCFVEEIKSLENNQQISKKSSIKNFNPFLENWFSIKLLKVGGRLQNSELPYTAKCPIILPKNHKFVKAYITHLHIINFHAGQQALLAFIRQEFWVINARRLVNTVVNSCLHCFKYKPKLKLQIMGSLPANRTIEARPFLRSGVDFFGPLYITQRIRNKAPIKTYVAVFVCFTTKASHLELVSDMSTKTFVAALKRFVSRRGKPQHLFCDNGTNFVGARRELQELRQLFLDKQARNEISSWCSSSGIQFHHIPPRAPHFGGLWEAAVKSAKKLLLKVIGESKLTFEELNTLIIQAEAILNSRPIVPLSSNPSDLEALTPGHFLISGPLNAIVEPTLEVKSMLHINRWRYLTQIQQHFWQRWRREYLMELQTRKKWLSPDTNVEVDTLVLIAEDNVPPQQWLLGRVVRSFRGSDGHVRVVEIKTKNGIIKRSIQRTAPIPVELNDPTENSTGSEC